MVWYFRLVSTYKCRKWAILCAVRQVPKFNKGLSNIPVVGMQICDVFIAEAINIFIKILLYIVVYIITHYNMLYLIIILLYTIILKIFINN
jgi:hypothetical protein